jgi:NADPH-dependent 2,4-dienoyl-CoA reductase/sulfur reductase-like enzyme
MRTQGRVAVFLVVLALVGWGCYRWGSAVASSKAAAANEAEYGNDWNGDLSTKHSTAYSLGYARGHAARSVETRQRDFEECGSELARPH